MIAPCLLVRDGARVVGIASRHALEGAVTSTLCVLVRSDGQASRPLGDTFATRFYGVVTFSLHGPFVESDVVPLLGGLASLGSASRGDAALVGVQAAERGFRRVTLPVDVETLNVASRGGGGDDATYVRAHLREELPAGLMHDGAPLLVRHPASRALGRGEEWLFHGVGRTQGASRLHVGPGRGVPFAELVSLPDELLYAE